MSSRRQLRVAELLQRELAEIIAFEMRDPRLSLVTITRVRVSTDLKHANVYLTSLGDDAETSEAISTLNGANGYLRRQLGARTVLRYVPDLSFHLDESSIESRRIGELLDSLDIADDDESDTRRPARQSPIDRGMTAEPTHFASFQQAEALIAASHNPLLVCHISPDGDAIGSLLGLMWLLRARGKAVTALSQDGVPENLRFLPGSAAVATEATDAHDLLIALDCSDPGRLGKVGEDTHLNRLPLVNIDHHITNPHFGAVNIVDPLAASTAELLCQLVQALGWEMPINAAQCLLAGIVSDTLGFRTSNTSARSLYFAQQMMEAGGSLHQVTDQVLERRRFDSICLWGQASGGCAPGRWHRLDSHSASTAHCPAAAWTRRTRGSPTSWSPQSRPRCRW